MSYVLFLDKKQPVEIEISKQTDHVIRIYDKQPNLSGFHVTNAFGSVFGKFETFNTLYRQTETFYEVSNDGSIYTEHQKPTEPMIQGQVTETIQDVKKAKYEEIKRELKNLIERGVTFETHVFPYGKEQITSIRNAYSISSKTGENAFIEDAKGIIVELTPEQIRMLYNQEEENRISQEAKINPLFKMVNDAKTKEEVKNINTKTVLSGTYLQEYEKQCNDRMIALEKEKLVATVSNIQRKISIYEFDDVDAIKVKELYAEWITDLDNYNYSIMNTYDTIRFYNNKLYRLIKDHTKSKTTPDKDTVNWVVIEENIPTTLDHTKLP